MVGLDHGLACDPQFRWWYTEDDLEMQARQIGPVGLVGACPVEHRTSHGLDPLRARWAVEDRERFVAKWGCEPW